MHYKTIELVIITLVYLCRSVLRVRFTYQEEDVRDKGQNDEKSVTWHDDDKNWRCGLAGLKDDV